MGFQQSIRLSAEHSNTVVARRFLADALADVAVDGHVAALLATEVVANAVIHAATEFDVVVTIGDVVRVEVRDGAAVTAAFREIVAAAPRHVEPSAPGGRGLMLVARLAAAFGLVDYGRAGKAVWFELPIASGATDDATNRR